MMGWSVLFLVAASASPAAVTVRDTLPGRSPINTNAVTSPIPDSVDAITLAMQMEQMSVDHYRSLEMTTPVKEFRAIYHLLVRDEQKHYRLLERWKKELLFDAAVPTDILEKSRRLLSEFPIDTVAVELAADTAGSFLRILTDDYDLEKKSVALYEDAISRTAASGNGAIYVFLAREERNHVLLLEKLIECAKQPEKFLRAKQFNELEKEENKKP
jgi:rubrerythrin